MTRSELDRINGLALLTGAVAFSAHIVLRSLITAGVDTAMLAAQPLWVPVNALGAIGAMLVLVALPLLYARLAGPTGRLGLIGLALIAVSWIFFSVFLSLYSMLVLPWLTDKAPALVAASAPPPTALVIAFIVGLLAWLVGAVLLAIPFIRGRVGPRWVGYLLPASAVWVVVGDFFIAPNGPAANVVVNLLSNLGPILLLIALGRLALGMRSDPGSGLGKSLPA